MTTALRPLRIRLVDPTQVGDLLAFLRGHCCVAEQVDAVAIDVWPPALLHQHGNGRNGNGIACASCGEAVEAALQRLGSPRCHDCRGRALSDEQLGNGRKSEARDRGRRALSELQGHLVTWRSQNGAAAAIVD
ncbi:MAG: hypothetical protein ACXWZP_07635 [Gaiellaceae bacterium]